MECEQEGRTEIKTNPVVIPGLRRTRQAQNPESVMPGSENRLTRAIHGARAERRLWRSRLHSCKRSRVPRFARPGMTSKKYQE